MMNAGEEIRHVLLRQIRDMLKYEGERAAKMEQFWRERIEVAERDPKKFAAQEQKSGSSMYDDPPPRWTLDDLTKYSIGEARGRNLECGNLGQRFSQIADSIALLLTGEYGSRPGLPSVEEIAAHEFRHIRGYWVITFRVDVPVIYVPTELLALQQGRRNAIRVLDGEKWRALTRAEKRSIATAMPVTPEGVPAAWPEFTKLKGDEE